MKKLLALFIATNMLLSGCTASSKEEQLSSRIAVNSTNSEESAVSSTPVNSSEADSTEQSTEESTADNVYYGENIAKVYYDYLTSLGEIETEAATGHGGGSAWWNVYDLYYYLDDINDDGIIDLTISAEKSDSNGIEIYTYKNGQVEKLISKRMPYSAGTEIFTLAKYEDTYGIKYLRFNSVGDFAFFRINKDGTIELLIEGWSYDPNGNALDEADNYDKINPITFYNIEELERMS